ncbi:MAG: DinB family protein [Terriglobales bacterium]
MRKLLPTMLLCLLALPAFSQEKQPSDNPLSAFTKRVYGFQKGILLRSAEKVPEEDYNFKPTETVRSYGQIIGHLADAQYLFCSKVLDEKNPEPKIEQTKTSKPDLIAALKTAFAYCDKAYDGMTDASGGQMVKLFGTDTPKLGVLIFNNVHNWEHYGNLVTYMRIKNIVPPSSEQAQMPAPKQEKPESQPKK